MTDHADALILARAIIELDARDPIIVDYDDLDGRGGKYDEKSNEEAWPSSEAVQAALRVQARGEVRPLEAMVVRREPDDPLALRASIGQPHMTDGHYYLTYRGDPRAVLDMLRRVMVGAEAELGKMPRRPQG
jgi:hypothetical protein